MSDGTGVPGHGPQGTPPAGPGGAQNQQSVAPGPVPPPSGGFGPPPASYGPVVPSAQPLSQPVPPVPQPRPQPVAQPQPQPMPQPQPQPQSQPVQPTAPQPQWQQQPPQQPVPPQRVEPNWEALADRNEADGKRKRRMRVIGIVAAVVVVGGLAAGGVLLMGKKDDTKKVGPVTTASASNKPTPGPSSASATPGGQTDDPSKPIWEAATDPAPQDAGALFSAMQVTVNGATWNRTVVSLDQPCWDGNSTTGGLGKILGDQGCQKVLRATYVSGDSAVTVGVAVFDHKIQAETAVKNYAGQLKGLPAPGAPAFCANPGCTSTHSSLGRYDYFTVEGSAKGGNAPDATATAAASGFAEHVKGQLLQRAKAAGSATPGSQGTPAATPAG